MNTNNEYRRGEEIVENTVTKLIGVKTIVMALIVNVLFGVAIIYLASDTGLVVYFWGSLFRQTGAVLFQIWMNFGHLLTYQSMNDSTAHYIGYLISQPDGYSLAAVGFAHSNVIEKLFFPAKLSYRSTCRKMLRYHVMIWIFHSILILLTVFSSATITTDILRIDSNRMACNIYGLDSVLSDRGFPTLEVVMGAGEYIFGTALGIQRSEVSVPITRHVFPPQLTDDAYDDQNIVGSGFITDISTTCKCSTSNNPADLILAGARADIVPGLQSMYATLGGVAGLANHLAVNSTAITATTILSGFNKCGGRNRTSPALSICKTVMSNHKRGTIVAAYMTDGTPASIAIREAIIRTEGETVSINWPYQALVNLLGSEYAAIELPQVYPGSVNPLIWWTTKDMQSVNTGLLEPGLETTFSLLLRTAIQRSYSTKASYCAQNIIDPNSAVLKMSTQGIWIGAIFSIGQIIVLFVCIFGSSHWFRSSNPILPCIRLASDGTFFTLMLSGSFTSDLLASLPPSTPNSEVWRILDVKVRLGASILAKDDPDMGFIILDKPKLITNFEREKKYV
ncbi:hypothetical protein EDD86DRAFT_253469 [Gorgonomyces haynaldii]|nr:hypothetical protein EDD86DRAFT_253469 [Gorgonomyces haynaldii]